MYFGDEQDRGSQQEILIDPASWARRLPQPGQQTGVPSVGGEPPNARHHRPEYFYSQASTKEVKHVKSAKWAMPNEEMAITREDALKTQGEEKEKRTNI